MVHAGLFWIKVSIIKFRGELTDKREVVQTRELTLSPQSSAVTALAHIEQHMDGLPCNVVPTCSTQDGLEQLF